MTNPYQIPADKPWSHSILFRVEVGSTAHGTGLDGVEDYDEIACIRQPIESMVGIDSFKETIVYRPGRSEGERSGPGDWDLTLHTARKWCRLAAAGNPSMLVALFGPRTQTTERGLELLDNYLWFWNEQSRQRFLGYSIQQRERLEGTRGGRHTNRPELEEEFGFDTKYAMHMVRLGYQGIEYLHTGRIELPMDNDRGDILRGIRKGEMTKEEVISLSKSLNKQLKNMETDAPEHPDYAAINKWLVNVAKDSI